MQWIQHLFNNYGYTVLVVSLTLELLAFPLPGETLMSYCGYLIYMGKMNLVTSEIMAFTGVCLGVTSSYFIGRIFGIDFFKKYGKYLHINEEKFDNASKWFDDYGNTLLIFTYFIPGVRHITGYTAGITGVSLKKFMINAYTGAFIWTFTFLSIGRLLGEKWDKFHSYAGKYMLIFGIVIAAICILIIILKYYKNAIVKAINYAADSLYNIYKSVGKIKMLFVLTQIIFLIMVMLITFIIRKILRNDFIKFNITNRYIVKNMFSTYDSSFMKYFLLFQHNIYLVILSILLFIFLFKKWSDKKVELLVFLNTIAGGIVVYILINAFFINRAKTHFYILNNFPCRESFIAIIFCGYAAFEIFKYCRNYIIKIVGILILAVTCIFTGLAAILFNYGTPSAVLAAYVFGFTWLIINFSSKQIFVLINNRASMMNK